MIFIEKRQKISICNIWVVSQTWLKAPALSEQFLLPLLPLLVKQRRNCWTPAVNFRPPPQFNSISPLQFNLQPSHWKFHKFPEEFVQRHSSFLQPVHSQTPKCQRISIGLFNEQALAFFLFYPQCGGRCPWNLVIWLSSQKDFEIWAKCGGRQFVSNQIF